MEAIGREKNAGVPVSKIRVGANKSLSSGHNPMGLGVFNTRDEPKGLSQGVGRSKAMGIDPKRHGAAAGFVPNYAPPAIDFDAMLISPEERQGLIMTLDRVEQAYAAESEAADQLVTETKQLAYDMGLTGGELVQYNAVLDLATDEGKKTAKANKTLGKALKRQAGKVKDAFFEAPEDSKMDERMLAMSMAIPVITETIKSFGSET